MNTRVKIVKSLQGKIFFFFVLLLLLVQLIAVFTVNRAIEDQEAQKINNQISSSRTLLENEFSLRSYFLSAFSTTVSKDFALKQFFQENQRTFLGALNNHRKRVDADLAIALNGEGSITSQIIRINKNTDKEKLIRGSEVGQAFRYHDRVITEQGEILYLLDKVLYKLSIAPLKSGEAIFGWVGFGFSIDSELASNYASSSGFTVEFILNDSTGITSLASSEENPINNELIESIIEKRYSDAFVASYLKLGTVDEKELGIVLVKSKADLLAALKERWIQLFALVTITLILSLAGAYYIAKSITKPVTSLVRQAKHIGKGNYAKTVEVNDNGELGQLATEFRTMQKAILSREQEIRHRAYHDSLTNLPNRNALIEKLNSADVLGAHLGLYVVNIRHLRDVNDTMGHAVGDKVIREVGKRFSTLSQQYYICHIGADEFVFLETDFTALGIKTTIEKIDALLVQPLVVDCITLYLQVRMGIAISPEHGVGMSLLQKADSAIQLARNSHKHYKIYDVSADQNTLERLNLISELKTAIENDQLVLFYQPKVCLKTMQVTHVEALVRWQHEQLGMVPPDKFISIAEQTGQIAALSRWVLAEAVRQIKVWIKQNIKLSVAINISAHDLKDESFALFFDEILEQNEIDRSAITLEVTESAVVDDPDTAINLLQRFKEQGVHLSIDDYGTGYSSLAQLRELPVHELKIDKSFVLKLPDDEHDRIIVLSTINLAHNMGLSVVAEGVESKSSMEWLAQHGCELAQGFHIARPLAAKDFEHWLKHCEYFDAEVIV